MFSVLFIISTSCLCTHHVLLAIHTIPYHNDILPLWLSFTMSPITVSLSQCLPVTKFLCQCLLTVSPINHNDSQLQWFSATLFLHHNDSLSQCLSMSLCHDLFVTISSYYNQSLPYCISARVSLCHSDSLSCLSVTVTQKHRQYALCYLCPQKNVDLNR